MASQPHTHERDEHRAARGGSGADEEDQRHFRPASRDAQPPPAPRSHPQRSRSPSRSPQVHAHAPHHRDQERDDHSPAPRGERKDARPGSGGVGGRGGGRSPAPREHEREASSRAGNSSKQAHGEHAQHDDERAGRTDMEWLRDIATRKMKDARFRVDFNDSELQEVDSILHKAGAHGGKQPPAAEYPEMEPLPWVSIDNDDTRDIDQITAAVQRADGSVVLYVGIADVDVVLPEKGALYHRAAANTTSVYTPAQVFTMLPEELCYDVTSLVQGQPRKAVVFKITFDSIDAEKILEEKIFHASITNQAKLAYIGVSAWLDGKGPLPAPLEGREDLQEAIKLQDRLTTSLLAIRRRNGTLEFDHPETQVSFHESGHVSSIKPSKPHVRASELIENVMIAANGAMSRYLEARGYASIQRVLPKSERWAQIVDLAAEYGERLDATPTSTGLRAFLAKARAKLSHDVELYRDLCMSVIKLLGRGEYVASDPGSEPVGHFALAVSEYSHSTAPNRRFPDIMVHRILKAALRDQPSPYTREELDDLAQHCSERETEASRVERNLRKAAACIVLQPHLGAEFSAFITGVSAKGVFARFTLADVPAEGRLVRCEKSRYRVGQRIRATLVKLGIDQGHIDIEDAEHPCDTADDDDDGNGNGKGRTRSGAASRARGPDRGERQHLDPGSAAEPSHSGGRGPNSRPHSREARDERDDQRPHSHAQSRPHSRDQRDERDERGDAHSRSRPHSQARPHSRDDRDRDREYERDGDRDRDGRRRERGEEHFHQRGPRHQVLDSED